jgi:hypothetical protein
VPTVTRAVLLAGAAVVGLGVLGTGVATAASADEVPRGTVVRDVDLGGLTRSEAVDKLDGSFTAERTGPQTASPCRSTRPGPDSGSTSTRRSTTRWTPAGPAGCARWWVPSAR